MTQDPKVLWTRYRQAYEMRCEGMTFKAIGERLNISITQASVAAARGERKYGPRLDKNSSFQDVARGR